MAKLSIDQKLAQKLLELSDSYRNTYLYLFSCADPKTGIVNETIKELSIRFQIHHSSMWRRAAFLEAENLIKIDNQKQGNLLKVYVTNSVRKATTKKTVPTETTNGNIEPEIVEICKWFMESLPTSRKEKILNDQKKEWVSTLRKCHKKDGYSYEDILNAVKWGREDDFWRKNFFSLNKLQTKNKQNAKYIEYFHLMYGETKDDKDKIKSGREISNQFMPHESDFN